MLHFAALAANDVDAVNAACEDLKISQQEGFTFLKMLTDIGLNNTAEITNALSFDEYVKAIS